MEASEMDALVRRLVANPHDQEALAYAHDAGTRDPKSYAVFLERVGTATPDPAYSSYWLSEAANVWSVTLGDLHRAARVLMVAVDKDPTQESAAERLAQLYREKGESKALVALLERRAKALTARAASAPEVRIQLAGIHEELGRLWSEPPLATPRKALDNYRRAIELDPSSAYAIYAIRELYKQAQQWTDALPFYGLEQAIATDPERKIALYRDEADVRKAAGDRVGATDALRMARMVAADDAGLGQELAASILERLQLGENVAQAEREEAVGLFVSLAEMYPGEHGFAYASAALDVDPGNDRALQLVGHYAVSLGRSAEIVPRYAAYLAVSPDGALATEARARAAANGAAPRGAALTTEPAPPESDAAPRTADAAARSPGLAAAAPEAPALPPAPPAMELVPRLLETAGTHVSAGQKVEALATYREVLGIDPANPEALAWVADYLRQKRQYADLRDVLLQATRSPQVPFETKKQQLLEVAGLCESHLRDNETAINAWKQICQLDRADPAPAENLRRLLERGGRWDELASVLEQEATAASDIEDKIALEKKIAQLHEVKRKDPTSAGEAWARIAALTPGDEGSIDNAVKLFEKAERRDLAAQVLEENVAAVEPATTRAALCARLGEIRVESGDPAGAGEAYVRAAESDARLELWEAAEKHFRTAERWDRAAYSVGQQAELTEGDAAKAALLARAATLLERAGEVANALLYLEGAATLDPGNDDYARGVEQRHEESGRWSELAEFLLGRAERLGEAHSRLELRRRAARIQKDKLADPVAARATLVAALADGEDAESLDLLARDAEERGAFGEANELLARLAGVAGTAQEKTEIALRQGKLLAESLRDPDAALERYEWVLANVDSSNREALRRIGELEENRGNSEGLARALERSLALAEDADKVELARKLAALYEGPLEDRASAVRVLELVHRLDPEDYDALARLETLCEQGQDWPRVAELLGALLEIEGDDETFASLSLRRAEVLERELGKGEEALGVLLVAAENGGDPVRRAYVEAGDRLGRPADVAAQLLAWNAARPASPERDSALRGAFDRFVAAGCKTEAIKVGVMLARSEGSGVGLAHSLEQLALELKDLEALAVAHELLVRGLSGPERAVELVRQAEILVQAGVARQEAVEHGEGSLGSVQPNEVEPLLARLAALQVDPEAVVEVYERQVARCRQLDDKLVGLARAAQVAAEHGILERAREFYDLALSHGGRGEQIAALEASALEEDEKLGGRQLLGILAEALAAGGREARDGGRTRGLMLRRAASIAQRELKDPAKAFEWLGDALIAHVDTAVLDALEQLATQVGDLRQAEAVLGRALGEVFDGPLLRLLLARRVALRRDRLHEPASAVEDLKRLHELSPGDATVTEELSALLTGLGDFGGTVHVLEDQILRGKDPAARLELARRVARLWEEKVGDPRETADAWRRVLRMKAGDPEAHAGLERAKSGMLRVAEQASEKEAPSATEDTVPSTKPSQDGPFEGERPTLVSGVVPSGSADVGEARSEAEGVAPPENGAPSRDVSPPQDAEELIPTRAPQAPHGSEPTPPGAGFGEDESTGIVPMTSGIVSLGGGTATPRVGSHEEGVDGPKSAPESTEAGSLEAPSPIFAADATTASEASPREEDEAVLVDDEAVFDVEDDSSTADAPPTSGAGLAHSGPHFPAPRGSIPAGRMTAPPPPPPMTRSTVPPLKKS